MTIKEIIKDPSTKIVDVRSVPEYKTGHINGALNIPLDQIQQRYKEIRCLGEIPVVVYCRSGNRSGQAVTYLQRLGFEQVYNGGGMSDLQHYIN